MAPVDFLLGGATLLAGAALQGAVGMAWDWVGPGLLLAGWSFARWGLERRSGGRGLVLVAGALAVGLAALLPAWPGADAPGVRMVATLWALLAGAAWRGLARLAAGPNPAPGEYGRILILIALLLATWAAYVTPCIVGVVDERWYGDLMTDFLGQLRAGVFPVLVGQGEFAWNGNVHPFRSAPMHHHLGGLVDLLTLRQLAPLAVQHVVVVLCECGAVLLLYAGLRRLRPSRPWFALGMAVLFSFCPAVTVSQIQHDMYMTAMALPVVVVVVLALVRVLDAGSWRAWITLGAGIGVVWFCHPPVAFLASTAVGGALLCRFVVAPVEGRDWMRAGVAGAVFVAVSAGYFLSMKDVSSLRHGFRATLEEVFVPAAAWVAGIVGLTLLTRTKRAVGVGLAAGSLLVAAAAIQAHRPQIFMFTMATLGGWTVLWWVGRRIPTTRLDRWPELLLAGCALLVGMVLAPDPAGAGTVDSWLESASAHYAQLWLPLRLGGTDQLGLALAVGMLLATWAIIVRPRPAERGLWVVVAAFTVALIPIPGFARFFWQQIPGEIVEIIGVAYPLRFLPVTAPFAAVLIYLVATEETRVRWGGRLRLVLLCLLPWALWEHVAVVGSSWRFRHSETLTTRHLRSENRAISKFHYDLLLLPRYHNHGVTDYRLETRLWERRADGGFYIGPNEYADGMAAAQAVGWQDVVVRQDPTYPAWLYLAPEVVLAPGERRLLTFEWLQPGISGWLICRSETIHREYLLPEFGGSHSFGVGHGKHQTLSLWNSGPKPEKVELVIKREGPDANQPYDASSPVARLRVVNYDAYHAPVEIMRLVPLQMRTTTETAATVETFRTWLPGYRVSLDGRPIDYQRSHNGLLEFQVPAGSHVADIRFRGTPQLRMAVYWSLCAGLILLVALGYEGVRLAQTPNHPPPVA